MIVLKHQNTSDHISIFGYINNIYHYFLNLKIFDQVLPKKSKEAITTTTTSTTTTKSNITIKNNNEEIKQGTTTTPDLFPKTINYQQDLLNGSTATPCSMQTSKLNKVINPDGTISWDINIPDHKHSHHNNNNTNNTHSNITSPFLTSTGSTISTNDELSPAGLKFSNLPKDTPSPYSINEQFPKSDEDSTHSLDDIIPDLPHPDFFNISEEKRQEELNSKEDEADEDLSPQHHSSSSSSSSPKSSSNKIFTCEYCKAEFRIRGYLTRHIKKHAINKAYECPFFNPNVENKCHPNGGFSRRDTYKTHLKARHFKYPQGTRSQDRPNTPGKCGMCGKGYANNEDWVEHHIENGECEMLPEGYEGRIKNSRRRNYEFPNNNNSNNISNGDVFNEGHHSAIGSNQILDEAGSGHSSGNDENLMSPHTDQDHSPDIVQSQQLQQQQQQHYIQQQEGINQIQLSNVQKMLTMNGPVVLGNDYDENDEYSLDTEQAYSFYRY